MIRHWGRLTGSPLSSTVAQWGRRGILKSIQRGTVTLNNVTSNTATVTAVDPNHAVLHLLGWTSAGATANQNLYLLAGVLTNATTITVTVNGGDPVDHLVSYELVEYWPGVIKTLQRGAVASVTAASATATITAVTLTKAQLVAGGMTQDLTNGLGSSIGARLDLTNATTVTLTKPLATGTYSVPFQVVEYY